MDSTTPSENRSVKTALFICSGNYYRSRFAEHLFNALARERGLLWTAISRGTIVEDSKKYFRGQIAPEAEQALDRLSIPFRDSLRDPRQLTPEELAVADLAIAVNEIEHRPDIERDFLAHAERVQYWGVQDVGFVPAHEGLACIERHVRALIDRLHANP